MFKKIMNSLLIIFLFAFIVWLIATGMLYVAKNMYEDNHKKVSVIENFGEYSTIDWVNETSPQWHSLENIFNILKNIGAPLELITFIIWRTSALTFFIMLLVKYCKEELEE